MQVAEFQEVLHKMEGAVRGYTFTNAEAALLAASFAEILAQSIGPDNQGEAQVVEPLALPAPGKGGASAAV